MRVGFLCALLTLTATVGRSQSPSNADGLLAVSLPRIDARIQIDGRLDEEVWSEAALLTGFFQFLPTDNSASEDSTHVLTWYAPTGIYFGIRAFEAHDRPHATVADRDKIDADDYILLILDTFEDERQAFALSVNPLGIQADGIIKDAARSRSVIAQADENVPYWVDLTPDFVFDSKGELTSDGYQVEIFVPFKSLRYPSEDVQAWGFNVVRRVQHSGYSHAWSRIVQSNVSFLSQSGRLTGLTDLRRGLVLDVSPVLTWSAEREPESTTDNFELDTPEPGLNVRWGMSSNLTLNATANPDFSQVEADVARVTYDPRQAIFFPEKRPFFLEGIELFETPRRIIYSRRLANPLAAVKLTGKVSETNVGFLSGVDRRSTSITGDDPRFFNALRVSRDLRGQSTIGIAYTDKIDGSHTNRVAAVDGRIVLAGQYSLTFQASGSFTRDGSGAPTDFAPMWLLFANRSGRRFGFSSRVYGTGVDFNAESGFISRTDLAGLSVQPWMTIWGPEGATLEYFTASVDVVGRWRYGDFVRARSSQDRQLFLNAKFGLRGGWLIGPSVLIERFGYPPELYEDYFIERTDAGGTPVDTVAFTGSTAVHDLSYALSIVTPRFSSFSGNAYLFYGRDVNWWEWASADLAIIDAELGWTPTDRLRVDVVYKHVQYIRPSDRSTVQIRRIPRLKIEYQLTRSIFLRFVGQYDSDAVDDLRDNSRTEDPILIRTAEGHLERAVRRRTNDLRLDWLFSYRPTPGTVFFFGYGSSLIERESFRFRELDRVSDGFFLKISYLFRS
jgi:hypothetical protein